MFILLKIPFEIEIEGVQVLKKNKLSASLSTFKI